MARLCTGTRQQTQANATVGFRPNPLNNDPTTGPWAQQPSVTKSNCTLAGFASGARIWVRVRGIGTQGPGDWSDPATIIVP